MKPTAEQKLRNPTPGSAIDRAREFGIDLSLLVERLRLPPGERVRQLQQKMLEMDRVRGAAGDAARG